ncbi:MAG TPA: c-type cytochrome [Bacteroidia bacterium]|nr:c-type cytochrome [Bacteroidia bacterium]
MKHSYKLISIAFGMMAIGAGALLPGCTQQEEKPALTNEQMVERGRYLSTAIGCNHCHSPKIMTPQGPIPDETRLLSGSPADMKFPAIDSTEITPGKWYLCTSDLTAWVGPWGISYGVNLTPDSATGIGTWTEELFIKILRTGKFMGAEAGRPIMPPMPWQDIGNLSDEDLKSIFAYLRSLPAISNNVHAYVPPNEIMSVN